MPGEIGIGDVIRAWRELGATTDEERRAIAQLLGYDLRGSTATKTAETDMRVVRPVPGTTQRDTIKLEPPPTSDAKAIPLELVPYPDAEHDVAALPSRKLARPESVVATPVESLFAANWKRSICASLCARRRPYGAIDLGRTIDLFARRLPVRFIRRDRLVSASEIAVVIDRKGVIAWFRLDTDQLIEQLNGVTRAPVTVMTNDGPPDLGEDDTLRIGAGGRVIAITDLGCASPWAPANRPRVDAWVVHALALRARGASLVVVTPVPPDRVPQDVARVATCIYWDGRTRAGAVHREIKRRS